MPGTAVVAVAGREKASEMEIGRRREKMRVELAVVAERPGTALSAPERLGMASQVEEQRR